jgi:outer membrane protein
MKRLGTFAMAVAVFGFCQGAAAQTSGIVIDTQPNYVAVGLGVAPDYPGSDDFHFVAGPTGRVTFANERYVELVATQLSGNLINHPYYRLGPAINYRFGRDDVDDTVVDRMAEVDDSIEIGLTGGIEVTNGKNPRYRFRVAADFLHDVSGGHEGYVANLAARYWRPVGKPIDLGFGLGATYASGNFNSAFFDVTGADSGRSGLRVFDADGGLKDINALVALVFHFSPTWHLAAGFRYQRLLSDAADSPVVDQQGDPNQLITGIGVAYSW